MASSSMPLVTSGLHHPPSTSSDDGHGSTRPNAGRRLNEDPLTWCAWAHQGHRLWAGMPDSFWVFTYKVERCPFPGGDHLWTSCPYAHRGERARRRDPRRFPYAAEPCPDYEASRRRLRAAGSSAAPACARGVHCGYAHGVFETWLHPTRFRTVMCQRGAECTRGICFFAHSLAQRRREGDEVPLVVFPATPPPPLPAAFVPRAAPRRLAATSPSSSSSSFFFSTSSHQAPVSDDVVVRRPVDRVTLAMQQGHSVRLLTRPPSDDAAAGASSSCSASPAVVATPVAATASSAVPLSAPLMMQASPSTPIDDEDIDFVAMVTSCCLASEADSRAEGTGYPHMADLFMDIVRR